MKADIPTLRKPDILTLQRHLLARSLRLRQEKRKMRTSQRFKSEILDNAPALFGVRKGNPGDVQRRQL